jgi:hypothetical protein
VIRIDRVNRDKPIASALTEHRCERKDAGELKELQFKSDERSENHTLNECLEKYGIEHGPAKNQHSINHADPP